jgi:hypothetical protein
MSRRLEALPQAEQQSHIDEEVTIIMIAIAAAGETAIMAPPDITTRTLAIIRYRP